MHTGSKVSQDMDHLDLKLNSLDKDLCDSCPTANWNSIIFNKFNLSKANIDRQKFCENWTDHGKTTVAVSMEFQLIAEPEK